MRREAAWKLDGDAVRIGIRVLGGDPDAFYRLEKSRQIDVLATLELEQDREAKRANGGKQPVDVNYKTDSAQGFWRSVFR